ncbi:MAG: hypothetical protein DRR04_12290 [Gammaproteobacteria bacterium]|nr:MAG: hypothetical protein DRR04_12290 [Gammaproteobacteria bacterium]
MKWFVLLSRIVVGGLFVVAGSIKLRSPQEFANAIKAFKVFPAETGDHLIMMSTFTMPWVELIAGVLLIIGWRARDAALVISGMLAMFILAVISVIARKLEVDCGCFGKLELFCDGPIGACGIIRNLVMLAMALAVLVRGAGPWSVDSLLGRGIVDTRPAGT